MMFICNELVKQDNWLLFTRIPSSLRQLLSLVDPV